MNNKFPINSKNAKVFYHVLVIYCAASWTCKANDLAAEQLERKYVICDDLRQFLMSPINFYLECVSVPITRNNLMDVQSITVDRHML